MKRDMERFFKTGKSHLPYVIINRIPEKDEKNELRGHIQEISNEDSKVKVYVVPTNEELMIARDTAKLVK